jgi:hypothetical protein
MDKVIVQFTMHEGTNVDALFSIEESLHQAFRQSRDGYVDGHDIGQGKFNIFIHVRGPWKAVLARTEAFLKLGGAYSSAIIAKYYSKRDKYVVVHPSGNVAFAI